MNLMAKPASDPPTLLKHATLIMLTSTLVLTLMQAGVRQLSLELHPFQIVFLRSFLGFILLLPVIWRRSERPFATRRPLMHALRAALVGLSMLMFFYGLSIVPLAEASALSLLGVFFGMLGAVIFLGERLRLVSVLSALCGLVGALLIIKPGFGPVSWGGYLIVLSAATWGLSMVVVKELTRTESTISILTWTSLLLSPFTAIAAIPVWQAPSPTGWALALGIACTALIGHGMMARALEMSNATIMLPLSFTRLVWAGLLGFVLFAELPDIWVVIGSCIIAVGVLLTPRASRSSGG